MMDIPYSDNPAMRDMWDSMIALYTRFDLLPPTRLAVGRKLKEECDELIVSMKRGSDEEIADEAGDVIAVVIGAIIACGLDENDLMNGMYRVMAKNGAKNTDNYKQENGTIVKS